MAILARKAKAQCPTVKQPHAHRSLHLRQKGVER
jgi:hypothetical protein